MGNSILEKTGEQAPEVNKGHGVKSLGPSDSSDSGSDIVGGPGLGKDVDTGLDRGPHDDPDRAGNAGLDIGDANLDSDSDSVGTGERATAGRDTPVEAGWDVATDRVQGPDETELDEATRDETESDEPSLDDGGALTADRQARQRGPR